MHQMSFDFTERKPVVAAADSNDYHRLPPSEKQVRFAQALAARHKETLPGSVMADRQALSAWIERHKETPQKVTAFGHYPSSKQVAFAERIGRMKRRAVPDACFKDRTLMSRWIDSNL